MPGRLVLCSRVLATVSVASACSTTSSVTNTGGSTHINNAPTASVAAAGGGELCFGQTPTITGAPDEWAILGTEGVDVVVTNGPYGVDLLGGDDLLCITGMTDLVDDENQPACMTGDGSDRIDSSIATAPSHIFPGAGPDEVIGGPAVEFVNASDSSSPESDADVITTAGGRDWVTSGSDDAVDLGPGPDLLGVDPGASGGVFEGGIGHDSLTAYLRDLGEHSWKIDNRAGRISRDGGQLATFTSFSGFGVWAGPGAFRFIGSDTAETFTMGWMAAKASVFVRMNGGDDHVMLRKGAGSPL